MPDPLACAQLLGQQDGRLDAPGRTHQMPARQEPTALVSWPSFSK